RIKNCFKNGSRPRKHFVRRGSGDRARTSLEAPAPGRRDGTIRSPASYPARARELQSSEVWCQPAGARKSRGRMPLSGLGPAPPTYDLPAHSGLGRTEGDNAPRSTPHTPRLQLQGPGANLQWGRGDEVVEDVLRDE